MPKVHFVKKARKDNPIAKRGEPYYWWKHAFGPKQFSKKRPRPSQLTQSSFLSQLYTLQESIEDGAFDSFESIEMERDGLIAELQNLLDECQNSFDNMPEQLQDTSEAGYLLNERIEALEMAVESIESIYIPEEPLSDDEWEEYNSDWKDMNELDKEQFKEEWKKEQLIEFIQSINDNWPEG